MAYASDDPHFTRLTEVAEHSYNRQASDRAIHQFIIRHLMGEHHPALGVSEGGRGAGFPTGIPLLSMAARTMSRHLISKAPRVLANTADKKYKTFAENAEIAVNKRIQRSNLAAEFRECAMQSMVSFGVLFKGPFYVGTEDNMKLDLVVKAVDRADYFYDIRSATLEEADIQGHEFDLPIQDVRENPLFDERCRNEVTPDGARGSADSENTNFRRGEGSSPYDLYDYVRIRCAYDRRRNRLYYWPRHQPELKLAEVDWLGPRCGPYRYLYYEKPPGNAIPVSPLMHLIKKHRAFNMLDTRSSNQQLVAKALLTYTNASKEEAEAILNADDLQSVLQENGAVRWQHVGGAAPDTVSMAEKQKQDFNYATSGIMQSFMPQAETLGQERLLRGATNEMLEDMGGWAYQFVKANCEDIFWYDLRDPNPEPQVLRKKFETVEYEVQWSKEHRQFAMELEFDIDVEPYSYVERSPESRLADLLGALQIVMGMEQQAAAQGISVDVDAVVRTIAKYKALPELYDVLILNQSPEKLQSLLGSRADAAPTDPAKPNGRYRRESTSDGTGENMEMLRAMGRGQQRQQEMEVA